MANKRVSELAQITPAELDAQDIILVAHMFPSPESKKMTVDDFATYLLSDGNISGSFYGTSSYAQTASYALNATTQISSSHSLTSDYSYHGDFAFTCDQAYNAYAADTASYVKVAQTALTASFGTATFASNSIYTQTASYLLYVPGNSNGTASFALSSLTASYALNASNNGGSNGGSSSWASSSISASYASTTAQAAYAGYAYNGLRTSLADLATTASYANTASFSKTASFASIANISYTSIATQLSASWASSSISSSYANMSSTALTALYCAPNPNTIQYGIFSAISQSNLNSQIDNISITSPQDLTMSVDVAGTVVIPWTASYITSGNITLNLLNRTNGFNQVLDTCPVYINMGNNVATFSGGLTGSFMGSVTSSILGQVSASIQSIFSGSTDSLIDGTVLGNITGSISASLTGSDSLGNGISGSITGSVTGSEYGNINGSMVGSVDGSMTGSITGSINGTLLGIMTSSMMGTINGIITNNISGTINLPFSLMGHASIHPDNYMLYVSASYGNFYISPSRTTKYGINVNIGSYTINNDRQLTFYTDYPDNITFSSSLGGPFTDVATNIVSSGSNSITMIDLSGVNGNAYYAWTLNNCNLIKATNASMLRDIGGMPSSLLTMSIQTVGLTKLEDLSNTSLGWMTCTNTNISSLPSLPTSMSYININGNNLTNVTTLPTGLTQFYCNDSYIQSLSSLTMPSTIVSMSLAYNGLMRDLPSTLPTSLAYFQCNNNVILTAFPPVPPPVTYLDVSNCSLPLIEEDGICADLQGHGLSNGYLDLRGNASIASSPTTLTRISTLFSRGWTVLYS